MRRYYTCEHDTDLVELSSVECESLEEGAQIYANCCGDTSVYHTVYVHNDETLERSHTVLLKYEMSNFKILEVNPNVI